jgi:hypothetical protein
VRFEAFAADLLDHLQLLAELRERAKQIVDGAIGAELIEATEVEQHVLPDLVAVAFGLNELKVLVRPARLDATLDPEEHAPSIAALLDARKVEDADDRASLALHFERSNVENHASARDSSRANVGSPGSLSKISEKHKRSIAVLAESSRSTCLR